MLFCTHEFTLFFLLVFALYWSMPWHKVRVYFLLAASFYFYASWNPNLALLIVFSTTIDFFLARGIEASTDPRKKKLLLTVNIVGNLALLSFFKYTDFFLESISQTLLASGLSESAIRPLKLALPLGISFYTFEAISYMVDVYRGRIKAEKNLAHFQLFILFFPHLVAGPIVRGRDFLPQVPRRKHWSWPRMQVGAQLLLLGLIKKLAIADRMAQFADPVFNNPELFRSSALWEALIAYALQIYCDFSGYSDIALGCAHMLGFKLNKNFDMPYLSLNITEFWRRWHMSLGSWLRDYLYIPLGGSRGGNWRTCRNLMITMTLCGLWHGPSWNYAGWGALQGILLVFHRWFKDATAGNLPLQSRLESVPGMAVRWVLTVLFVCLGYILLRTQNPHAMGVYLRGLVVPCDGAPLTLRDVGLFLTVLAFVLGHVLAATGWWQRWWDRQPAPVLGLGYSLALSLALVLAPEAGKAFIYFQF